MKRYPMRTLPDSLHYSTSEEEFHRSTNDLDAKVLPLYLEETSFRSLSLIIICCCVLYLHWGVAIELYGAAKIELCLEEEFRLLIAIVFISFRGVWCGLAYGGFA